MVGKADLPQAIALNSAMFNGARIVGPALAGLLVARYGVAPAFFVNGLSFLAVIAALAAIHADGRPRAPRATSVRQDIAEGVRFAAGNPGIALALGLLLAVSLFVLNHSVLVPLLAEGELIGLLGAADKPGGFTDGVVQILSTFAGPVATFLRGRQSGSPSSMTGARAYTVSVSVSDAGGGAAARAGGTGAAATNASIRRDSA